MIIMVGMLEMAWTATSAMALMPRVGVVMLLASILASLAHVLVLLAVRVAAVLVMAMMRAAVALET